MLKEKLDNVGAAKVIKGLGLPSYAKLHNIVADLKASSRATVLAIQLRCV